MKKNCTYELSFLISSPFQDLLCVFLPSRQILSISSSSPLWYKNLHRKEDAKVQFIDMKNKSMATFPIDFLQEQAKNRWGAFLSPTHALDRARKCKHRHRRYSFALLPGPPISIFPTFPAAAAQFSGWYLEWATMGDGGKQIFPISTQFRRHLKIPPSTQNKNSPLQFFCPLQFGTILHPPHV